MRHRGLPAKHGANLMPRRRCRILCPVQRFELPDSMLPRYLSAKHWAVIVHRCISWILRTVLQLN